MVLSIIVPVYNERENIPALYERLFNVAKDTSFYDFEYIFVDDSSMDGSFEILKNIAKKDKRVKLLKFSRNFGSHIASIAGLSYSSGDAAIIMSADMQESPELIPQLIKKWQNGYKVVLTVREERDESKLKVLFAKLYFFIMRKIVSKDFPIIVSDMFLIDKKVKNVVTSIGEKNAILFGLICWSGFNQTTIPYKRARRKAGKSKWTFAKQIKVAIDSIVSFSYLPIRLSSYLGFLMSFIGFSYVLYIIIIKAFFDRGQIIAGWSSVMVALLIISGIQLSILGILGEYLWRSLEESRKRPLFVIDEKVGFDNDTCLE